MTDQEQPRVAMVVMAHPDDAEFGCGGTVAGWAREGWDVYYVICTDAAGGGPMTPILRRTVPHTRRGADREGLAVNEPSPAC